METSASPPPLTLAGHLRTRLPVLMVAVITIVSAAALLNPIQPVSEGRVGAGNPVLLAKLATAAAAWVLGVWGLLHSGRARRMFGTLAGTALILLATVFLFSGVVSPTSSRMISIAAALILIGYLQLSATALATFGIVGLARSLLAGLVAFLCLAWGVYIFVPSVGQFHEYIDAVNTVTRMGGVAHPNAIAHEAATAWLLMLGIWRFDSTHSAETNVTRYRFRWPMCLICLLVIATMVATVSRTAMLAVGAATIILMFDKLYSRAGLLLANVVFIAVLLIAGWIGLTSDDGALGSVASKVTKSGNVEELTSLTGRTRIWQEAWDLISQRPWIGYGMDSAASVMSAESVGTHNLLLHVVFSGGIIAGLLMIGLLIMTLAVALKSRQPMLRGVTTYVLVSGLVEDTILPSFPAALTLIWVATLLWYPQDD
ncbi:O-antigen ligase family protein [Roseiconus lacunae]|uniref:O-antigen ligase family protein n=1 Tax=Roseiconus lacunae TaxID=2605694 RepID=UPI001E3ED533|nr:O-antigen ligase family protein [Roseiconus lacunae]MCD0463123.1 O-antigen ligase family protein [Roseiconus lacunae]